MTGIQDLNREQLEARLKSTEATLSAIHNGQVDALVGIGREVRIIQPVSKFKAAQEKYRHLFEGAQDGIIMLDPESGRFTDVNKKACEMLGRAKQELLSLKYSQVISYLPVKKLKAIINSIQKDQTFLLEHTIQTRNGEIVPVEISVKEIMLDRKKTILAFVRNIKEREETEEKLRESEATMRTIVEGASGIIIMCSVSGTIKYINPEAERTFGYKALEVIDQHIDMLVLENIFSEHLDHIDASLTNKKNKIVLVNLEAIGLCKDGSLIQIMMTVNSVNRNKNQTVYIVLAKDVTEERKLQQDLIQSEKLAALGSMVAGISHEINTPIGIAVTGSSAVEQNIITFQKKWKEEGITEKELANLFESIASISSMVKRNAVSAAELIRSFKNISVDQCNEDIRIFNVADYLQMVITSMNHYLKRTKINMRILCSKDLVVKSYPGAFSQIFTNLMSNSLLHGFESETAGTIEISAHLCAQNDRLLLTYEDDGKGMAPAILKRICEPFFTTNRGGGGSGLGMHVVYKLITTTFKGQITCESSLGKGVFFSIILSIGGGKQND